MANGTNKQTVAILALVIAVISLTAGALAKYYALKGQVKLLETRWPKEGYQHLPIGSIVAYHRTGTPGSDSGWLPCDGKPVPGGQLYDTLRGICETTPDLRGMFLRGAGQNTDPNYQYAGDQHRLVGVPQAYATGQPNMEKNKFRVAGDGPHIHLLEGRICKDGKKEEWQHNYGGWRGYIDGKAKTIGSGENDGSHSHKVLGGDDETRPNNYAVNFIIKAF